MEQGSSDRNQGNRSRSSSQNRNRNRGGNRSGNRGPRSKGSRQGGNRGGGGNANRGQRNRDRKPAPKPTGWQKFVKAVTFGLVDPFEAEQQKKRAARKSARKKPLSVEPTGPRLYVGNLDFGITEEELESTFAKVGTVKEAIIVKQGRTGRSKGFGFVEMSSLEEAKEAVRKLNDTDFKGRSMLVTGAKSEKPEKKEDGEWKPSGDRRGSGREGREQSSRSGERRESRPRGERGERGRRPSRERSGEKESRTVKPREVAVVESSFISLSKLNTEASEEDVHDLFEGVGTIQQRGDRISDGTLVVELASQEEAQKAVSLLDGKSFMGSQVKVSEAEESDRSGLRAPAVANPTPEETKSEEVSSEPEPSTEIAEAAPVTEAESDDVEDVAAPAPEEEPATTEEAPPEETPSEESVQPNPESDAAEPSDSETDSGEKPEA